MQKAPVLEESVTLEKTLGEGVGAGAVVEEGVRSYADVLAVSITARFINF